MPPQQASGHWLNPDTGRFFEVSRHQYWIHDPENAQKIGLPEDYIQHIRQRNPNNREHEDEIRIIAMKGGLVRLRDNPKAWSIQFFATQDRLALVLKAVYDFFHQLQVVPWQLWIHNLQFDHSTTLSWKDFQEKITSGTPVFDVSGSQTPALATDDVRYDSDRIDRICGSLGRPKTSENSNRE